MFREFFGALIASFSPVQSINDQNTASSRLVSKSPDQRDSRNQTQKRPGDGTWDLHSGLTELLPVQGALSSFQASFRQPGEKFSALHKASLVSGSEFRTAVHWRATVRHGLVAQLVAHSAPNREVAGSTPAWSAFVSEQMTICFSPSLPPLDALHETLRAGQGRNYQRTIGLHGTQTSTSYCDKSSQ